MNSIIKTIKLTDAVLDCIPIVSSISNAAHAIYKLANKVDVSNPVAPGLKTSIKIHSLSKDYLDCLIGSIPIFGNLFNLVDLVLRVKLGQLNSNLIFCNGDIIDVNDNLIKAMILRNEEIVHLCLDNCPLKGQQRIHEIFHLASKSSKEVFKQVFNHFERWDFGSLLWAMRGVLDAQTEESEKAEKIDFILDCWATQKKALNAKEALEAVWFLESRCLKDEERRLPQQILNRILELIPDNVIPYHSIGKILTEYSSQYDYERKDKIKKTAVLTTEERRALIAKSEKPSLSDLQSYYHLSVKLPLLWRKVPEDFFTPHFDTLNRLIDRAELSPDEMGIFIADTIDYNAFDFLEPLVEKYETQLTPESKVKILGRLLALTDKAYHEKRSELLTFWVDRWKTDLSTHTNQLYDAVSEAGLANIQNLQKSPKIYSPENGYPTLEELEALNDQFKEILLAAFPGCDNVVA